jgi:RNA polymerase-binding transcription factor DksA
MLSEAQLDEIRRRLLDERTRLLEDLNRSQSEAAEGELDRSSSLSEAPTHMADRGTDTEDEEIDAANAEREIAELHEIDAALERLYQRPREFGRDERTGRDIPYERLVLIPWARTAD